MTQAKIEFSHLNAIEFAQRGVLFRVRAQAFLVAIYGFENEETLEHLLVRFQFEKSEQTTAK